MATVTASYSETNADTAAAIGNTSGNTGHGEAFTSSISGILDSSVFYLCHDSGVTGNMTSSIYNITGTLGTNAAPTGSALATSDPVSITTTNTGNNVINMSLITFSFSGANRISLTSGTNYAVSVEYSGGGAGTGLYVGEDTSAPSYVGNTIFRLNAGTWSGTATADDSFYVYVIPSGSSMTGISSITGVSSVTF